MKLTTPFLIVSLVTGILFFLIQHRVIIIHIKSPFAQKSIGTNNVAVRKKIAFFIPKAETLEQTTIEVLWNHTNLQESLANLIGAWITLLQDENILSRYLSLESVAYSPITHEVIISFSQSPLEERWSIMEKWLCIESLCKTIRSSNISASAVIFLVNNQEIDDDHLDISRPWPIDGFEVNSF